MKVEINHNSDEMTFSLTPETVEEASLLVYMSTNKTKKAAKVYSRIGAKDLMTFIDIPLNKNPQLWIEKP